MGTTGAPLGPPLGALLAVAVGLCLVVGCAAGRPALPPMQAAERPFIITFWCGPPLAAFDDARAAEIAAAGFTIVGPPCEGPLNRAGNLRALDAAERQGLRMWVRDHRFGANAMGAADWKERIAAAVADYRDHPALDGYFVEDEPAAEKFEATASVVATLRAADPDRLAYVNLLPDFVSAEGLGTDSYEEYLERFVRQVRPRLLSYDYYPFGKEKDRSSFFASLSAVRAVALRHGLPFMLIVQAMPHGPYRDPTEAELAWQVFHALAFGARGISYFTYWTPPRGDDYWNNHYGLVEQGRLTLHYFQVVRLNTELRALAAELAPFRSLAVADSTGEIGVAFPIGPIEAIDGGPVTAGLFVDEAGRLAVLLVNRDYRYGVTASLRLRPEASQPQVFDLATRAWRVEGESSFRLPPGGVRLIRWGTGDTGTGDTGTGDTGAGGRVR